MKILNNSEGQGLITFPECPFTLDHLTNILAKWEGKMDKKKRISWWARLTPEEKEKKSRNRAAKIKKTCLEKYGNENYNNPEKNKETKLKKYGGETVSQSEEIRNKSKKEKRKKYRKENKDIIKLKRQEYNKAHREEINAYTRKYNKTHRDDINTRVAKKIAKNINFRLAKNLRGRLRMAIKNKQRIGSAVEDLGCTIPELKIYLESKFQEGMSWENWNKTGWHIDHIKPLVSFNLQDREEFLKACHYTNLQPLWAEENYKKGKK